MFLLFLILGAVCMSLSASDAQPTITDWGMYTENDQNNDYMIKYASANLACIVSTMQEKPKKSLAIVCAYITGELIPAIKRNNVVSVPELIQLWQPLERFINLAVPDVNIALSYVHKNQLYAVLRGTCEMYHFSGNECKVPAYADATPTTCMQNDVLCPEAIVPLCGIGSWLPGDTLVFYTPNIAAKITPMRVKKLLNDPYFGSSMVQKARNITLCAYMPFVSLSSEVSVECAEQAVKHYSACIAIKNVPLKQ